MRSQEYTNILQLVFFLPHQPLHLLKTHTYQSGLNQVNNVQGEVVEYQQSRASGITIPLITVWSLVQAGPYGCVCYQVSDSGQAHSSVGGWG